MDPTKMNEFNIPDRFYKKLKDAVCGRYFLYTRWVNSHTACIICSKESKNIFCNDCDKIYGPIYDELFRRTINRQKMINRMMGKS